MASQKDIKSRISSVKNINMRYRRSR